MSEELNCIFNDNDSPLVGALELSRTSTFTPANGDRSNVPNFHIVVTDGNSDDPAATFDQAVRQRADGTFIIPIGINIRNLEVGDHTVVPMARR